MKKRRLIIISVVAVFFITLLSGCSNSDARLEVLKVMNWGDYIDESLNSEFEEYYREKTGKKIQVIYVTVDNPQIMATKIETAKEDWDLACPSESIAERMLLNGNLLPIDVDAEHMSNYRDYVSPFMKNAFAQMEAGASPNPENRYAVGYMWGTFGIMYNVDLVDSEDLTGWDMMWNPKFKGSILMKNAVREIFPIALTYVYKQELLDTLNNSGYDAYKALLDDIYDLNKNTEEKIALVEEALVYQRNIIKTLYETDDGKDDMINGFYALNQAWSGDAVWSMFEAAETDVNLDFYIPEEGSNIWYDAWVIPKYAKNKLAAEMYIDFLCIPENATRNMDYIGYTSSTASGDVVEWCFKTHLIENAIAENEELKVLSEKEEDEDYSDVFYEKYDLWYDNWYENHYENWYNEQNGEGIDLRYFFNEEGVTTTQLITAEVSEKTYYTDKILANSIQFPPTSDINKCAVMKGFASNITEINNMWVRVKGQSLPLYVTIIMSGLAVVAIGFIIWRIIKKNIEKKKLSKLLRKRNIHNRKNNV